MGRLWWWGVLRRPRSRPISHRISRTARPSPGMCASHDTVRMRTGRGNVHRTRASPPPRRRGRRYRPPRPRRGRGYTAPGCPRWNPYRNEIWTSLTLAEGVAMPYALFALVAARKAARSARPLRWEVASAACVLVALGCKNTFAALVPAQVALRMWPEGLTLREAWT